MATPLKDRIRAKAIANTTLLGLLGSNPFRWFDRQLNQGSSFPAVVVQAVSDPRTYALAGRLTTSFSRYQFTIWAQNNAAGMTSLENVERALVDFFESLDLVGIPGLSAYSNEVVAARDGFFPTPQPGNPQRVLDVMLFSNDSL